MAKDLTMTFDEYDAAEDTIQQMDFKAGSNYDPWYPTTEDVDKVLAKHSIEGVRFLMWCLMPVKKLTKAEQKVKSYIQKSLYDPANLVLVDLQQQSTK